MNVTDRKQKILQFLKENGTVRVSDLSKLFNISEVTVRNDLSDMETKGMLSRVHGGAISSYKPYYSMNFSQRLTTNEAEKKAIAEKAASMIEKDDTVMLNSGTTTLMVFRMLKPDINLNIVTNSVSIALEASGNPNYNVVLIGGSVNSKYQFTFGDDAVKQLKGYHAEKLILSIDGICPESGFTTYYDKEAEIDRIMLERSDVCIVAADFSKFNRTAFVKVSEMDVADYIVTNSGISEEIEKEIADSGTGIVLV